MGAFSPGSLSRVCSGALRDLRITFKNSVKNISRQYMNRIMGKIGNGWFLQCIIFWTPLMYSHALLDAMAYIEYLRF